MGGNSSKQKRATALEAELKMEALEAEPRAGLLLLVAAAKGDARKVGELIS